MTTTAPESANQTAAAPDIHPDLAGIENVVGVGEIAAEFAVAKSNVSSWANRRATNGFPLPLASRAAGPLYDIRQVRSWYASRYSTTEAGQ